MGLTFEWDDGKAAVNMRKHRVTFEEAATAFGDRLSLTVPDPDHSTGRDQRWITIGLTAKRRLVVVIHSDRGDIVRLVSARMATRKERGTYEEER